MSWRLWHALWALWLFVPSFGFVGFLYIGIRAGRRNWVLAGVVYALPLACVFAMGGVLPYVIETPMQGLMLVCLVHGLQLIRPYQEVVWARERRQVAEIEAEYGVARKRRRRRAPGRVDLNRGTLEELARLPGVGPELAKQAIAARPFRVLEDFGDAIDMKPHLVERLRELTVVEGGEQAAPELSSGRVVDF